MTWEEIQKIADKYIKWISPDLIYQNVLDYITQSDEFLDKEVERRFNYYKADPRYENLTDQCLMDMARADVEASKQAYGGLYYFVASVVNAILDLTERIGYYLGMADVTMDIGRQVANVERGTAIPDVTILVAVYSRVFFLVVSLETFYRG